ncbi:MAG: MFS transporter [Burkholderiales bacterium]
MLTAIIALGLTQTLAWASSTYLIAIVAQPIARDLGLPVSTVFAAFSVALVVMGFTGPAVGREIDRRGGRGALAVSNLVLAAGLGLLGLASNAAMLFASWIVLGIGMALGLYDAAFAALVRIFGTRARGPITAITLIAGFASTVGWPLTALIVEHHGWRSSCFAWAAMHLFIALPLNLLLIPKAREETAPHLEASVSVEASGISGNADGSLSRYHKRAFALVTLFASMAAFVTSAMAAHLPGLLQAAGTAPAAALTAAALVGPAQVAARLLEFLAAQRLKFHPLVTARAAVALHPAGAVLLILFGGSPFAASAFALLHGAGNGMVTIARGTLPLAIFGSEGYGRRQGVIGVTARSMQAVAPFAFGVVLERSGASGALAVTIVFSIAAVAALMALRPPPA